MKTIHFLVAAGIMIFFASESLFSQAAMNIGAKKFFNEYHELSRTGEPISVEMIEFYDLISDGEEHYVGILGLVDTEVFDRTALHSMNIKNDTRINDLWTFRVPVSQLNAFRNLPGLKYMEMAEPVDPFLVRSTVDSRADSVNRGLGLPRGYTGKGVIIAIIDWGFDYTHPHFFDSTLTDLRISRAWDQNKLSGPAPDGFSFGTEYVGQDALLEAGSDTLYVFGPSSHGTHVGGIAGGAGGGTEYIGAAPESELIFISLRRDGPSLVDAFQYVANYAESVGKPFVVNMSFGSHLGPHDGSSLKNYGIDMLNGPGRVFVGSAGNNGNAPFHLDMDFIQNPGDTMVTVVGVNFRGDTDEIFGQTVSMWGSSESSFKASVALANSSNEIVYQTPFFDTKEDPSMNEWMEIDGEEVHIIMESVYGHFLNDKPSMRWEIRNLTSHKVVLKVTSDDSHVHMWNCNRHSRRYTNWGVAFEDNYPGALAGDILYGVGEPAGVGHSVITVGSYLRAFIDVFGFERGGNLSSFTSSGPTVDERVKPDITSTGQSVTSSVSSFDPSYTSFAATVDFNGKTYGFVSLSGTSMSGPMVAGIVALMLEANPELSNNEIKEILIQTARLDSHTGELPAEGHLRWGHGKVNALAAVRAALDITSVGEIQPNIEMITIYPNPAKGMVYVKAESDQKILETVILDTNGKPVRTIKPYSSGEFSIDISELPTGIYLLHHRLENGSGFSRLNVIQ